LIALKRSQFWCYEAIEKVHKTKYKTADAFYFYYWRTDLACTSNGFNGVTLPFHIQTVMHHLVDQQFYSIADESKEGSLLLIPNYHYYLILQFL
tara:strand:- start:27323 stop:27604 length:282 start_codon:yes stop_codon:yes gene_type:complete